VDVSNEPDTSRPYGFNEFLRFISMKSYKMLKILSLWIHFTAAGYFRFKCNKNFDYRKVLKINTLRDINSAGSTESRMSKYFRVHQVNILDIWCNITRYFVSHFTANYSHISSGFSRWILRIFFRVSNCQLRRCSVLRLTVNIHDITPAVSLYFVPRFTANYLDISSGVIR